jgi:hypothetical protein
MPITPKIPNTYIIPMQLSPWLKDTSKRVVLLNEKETPTQSRTFHSIIF